MDTSVQITYRHYAVILLAVLLYLCLAGFFFFPHRQSHSFPTYLIALILLVTNDGRQLAIEALASKLGFFIFSLISYFTLTSILQGSQTSNLDSILTGILLLAFIVATSIVATHERIFRIVIFAVVITAVMSAIVSISDLIHLREINFDNKTVRLVGTGRLHHPIPSGLAFGFAGSLSLVLSVYQDKTWSRVGTTSLFLILVLTVFLTGSRAASLALASSSLVILLFSSISPYYIPKLVATLLVLAALIYSFAIYIGMHHISPSYYLNAEYKEIYKMDFRKEEDANKVKIGYYSDNRRSLLWEPGKFIVKGTDDVVGLIFPSFAVNSSKLYYIELRLRTTTSAQNGLYIRIMESNEHHTDERKHLVVDSPRNEPGIYRAEREQSTFVSNLGVPESWTRYIAEYSPRLTTNSASPLVMKWHGLRGTDLQLDYLSIYESEPSWVSDKFLDWDFEFLGRHSQLGFETRVHIWTETYKQIHSDTINFLFGHGFSSSARVGIRNRNGFLAKEFYDHSHSIYLSTWYYAGVLGLILFLVLTVTISRVISSTPASLVTLLALGCIVFSMVSMIFDGNKLFVRINTVWLIIWFYAGLGLSQAIRPDTLTKRPNLSIKK